MSKAKHEIAVLERKELGNNASRRARNNGLVPVNVYGNGKEGSRLFYVKANEWEIISKEDFSLAYLKNGSETIGAVVKEVQINYLKNHVLHIDFQEIDLHKAITVEIKVIPLGEPVGVAHDGVLEQLLHEIELVGTATTLPDFLEVDVTKLDIDQNIAVKDLALPAGVTAKTDADAVIFHVGHVAAEEVAAEPAEGAEGAGPEVLAEKKREDREKSRAESDKK
ncbi:MAG: 50S ribosomal protein L25 [Victivallaceae bacterium]|nr:50S ribosomal protein L25 [Victivallaceae bacterium]